MLLYFFPATKCNMSTISVQQHTVYHITYQSSEEGPMTCFYFITTDHNSQIVLTFTPVYQRTHDQIADEYSTQLSESCNDTESYIHIGNNRYSFNVKSWSSFLFCGDHHPPQFVSMTQAVWVVLYHPNNISVDFQIEALPKGKQRMPHAFNHQTNFLTFIDIYLSEHIYTED